MKTLDGSAVPLSYGSILRKTLRQAALPVLFCFILVSSLWCINGILMPKYSSHNNIWPVTATFKQFYKMKKNSVDVIFLGSSYCMTAMNPQALYNYYGIRSYNLSSEQQAVFASYYWLKEALRFQSPKVVVLDTHFIFTRKRNFPVNMSYELLGKCLDPMHFSSVKREFISDLCSYDSTLDPLSYYLSNIRFHTRWKGLEEDDFKSYAGSAPLKGFAPLYGRRRREFHPPVVKDTDKRTALSPLTLDYLGRMEALCREKGAELVLMSTPTGYLGGVSVGTVRDYADEHDLRYYNLGSPEYYDAMELQFPKECFNHHSNVWGADKAARIVGRILQEDCGVPSVEDEQWESTKAYYDKVLAKGNLSFIEDADEYLQEIRKGDYCIFMSVKDDARSGIKDSTRKNLRKLGLKTDLKKHFRDSYCAVIQPGGLITEKIGDDGVVTKVEGRLWNSSVFYKLSSQGRDPSTHKSSSSIIIDGKKHSAQLRGINIVVYDPEFSKVIDSVNFDTCNKKTQKARRPDRCIERL